MWAIHLLSARIKNYQICHFQSTKWGKNLRTLKGKFSGKRCFIVGNGPSLSAQDLDRLREEYTFAFNRIYYIFDQTAWRPTFYCTQDIKIAKSSANEICQKIRTPYIFAPINLKWYYNIPLETNYFFCQRQAEDGVPPFSEDIPRWIGTGNTVAYTAMQLAAYMGFEQIYLLGIDHSFQRYQDMSGQIVIDSGAKDYFCDQYNQDKDQLFVPRLDLSTCAYIKAQEYTKTHSVKIYNATRGGKLEVFPRVDFDALLE